LFKPYPQKNPLPIIEQGILIFILENYFLVIIFLDTPLAGQFLKELNQKRSTSILPMDRFFFPVLIIKYNSFFRLNPMLLTYAST